MTSSHSLGHKLALFPLATTVGSDGQLRLGRYRASDLVQQFGTPLYVYHLPTIRHQSQRYRRGLAGYQGVSSLTYACKAFLCLALARLMADEAIGLDVCSAGEIFVARRGGADPTQMHFHGNNKTRLDLEAALAAGVGRIVVDHQDELDLLAQLAHARQQQVDIWLRLTPNVGVETHHRYTVTGSADSKFGFPLAQAGGVAARLLAERSPLRLTGLHVHLGSHFYEAAPVTQAVEKLLDLAVQLRREHGWQLRELCAGGGWGVPYHPNDPPMPVEPFVERLVAGLEQACQARALPLPELVLEPGRSLVAQAGVALYTVGGRKAIPHVRTYVSVDGGLADNPRPALYQATYSALLANRAAEAEAETVAVAGPYCESGDVMIQAVELPVARPGDLLAVPVAGAYQISMSSNYNGALRPAVLFIDGDQARLVQRRETFEDLIQRDEALS
jgi:diaminopimelate decarboxylase